MGGSPAGAVKQGLCRGDPPAKGATRGPIAATFRIDFETIAAIFGSGSRPLVLGPVAVQHLSDGFGSLGNIWDFRAGLQQRLDCGDIIPRLAGPAVVGAVDGPAERRAVKVSFGDLQRRAQSQDRMLSASTVKVANRAQVAVS